jgi:DNA-binding NarL/FixJ family response regulator
VSRVALPSTAVPKQPMEPPMPAVPRPPDEPSPAEARLRVVIADPDPLARRAVRAELQRLPRFVVVAEATDGVEAHELCRRHRPELLVAESSLPGMDGIELTRRLAAQAPRVQVLVFSAAGTPQLEMRAVQAGASGFLSKERGIGPLGASLAAVARGEAAISRILTMRLIERLRRIPRPGSGFRPVRSTLTGREWEVLDLLAGGRGTREIAAELELSPDTVHSHTTHVMRKLGVRSRQEAVAAAGALFEEVGAA